MIQRQPFNPCTNTNSRQRCKAWHRYCIIFTVLSKIMYISSFSLHHLRNYAHVHHRQHWLEEDSSSSLSFSIGASRVVSHLSSSSSSSSSSSLSMIPNSNSIHTRRRIPMYMVMSIPETNNQNTKNDDENNNNNTNRIRNKRNFNTNNNNRNSNNNLYNDQDNENKSPTSSSSSSSSSTISSTTSNTSNTSRQKRRKKYKRKRPKRSSEQKRDLLRQQRQAEYERIMKMKQGNIWNFESLFPDPVWDEEIIKNDLYGVKERDAKYVVPAGSVVADTRIAGDDGKDKNGGVVTSGSSKRTFTSTSKKTTTTVKSTATTTKSATTKNNNKNNFSKTKSFRTSATNTNQQLLNTENTTEATTTTTTLPTNSSSDKIIDMDLTRLVEDRLYGYRRSSKGYQYDTSLMGDGAVKFRDGVRLGNPLKVNSDRLCYHARKELSHGRLEEAEELYERSLKIDPRDGRAYLGLSRVAQRRRDFPYAKDCLRAGIANSVSERVDASGMKIYDNGPNPFLLQALGSLEERLGHLSEAEKLYIAATKSRPCHAAAWVSLAQLRTRKLRQGPAAGRVCYKSAERELKRAGLKESSHVNTAWAALEYKAADVRKARELFQKALEIDPKCSAAWLQLGVMEADLENWSRAKECFETVLKYDQRNTRVMQAYAIMETKRPNGDSREAIELFERALQTNPRDGGVIQAYALYVAKLGDIDAARGLLRKGTEVDKRHAPIWQAWGVLETRHGSPEDARRVFQEGIWSCAQSSGGQSGGRRCARLWQAWGVLEAGEEDISAARRCFSRALDADSRNVAAVTAWTLMEEDIGNYNDARRIFERSLKQFSSPSDEKLSIWRAYELMEFQAGNVESARSVYQRSIRDAMVSDDQMSEIDKSQTNTKIPSVKAENKSKSDDKEIEISSWKSKKEGFGDNSVWMKEDGSIEGKVPKNAMKKLKQ